MKNIIERRLSRGRSSKRFIVHNAALVATLLGVMCVPFAHSQPAVDETLPSNYVPSGKVMYKQYCATCHGLTAKGDGPLGSFLKVPPADLTKLAQRNGGRFPYENVANVLQFGPRPSSAHGSSDMPTWGPLFEYFDKLNERAVQQRIKNLCDYLASLQEQ